MDGVRCVWDVGAVVGEGPLWDGRDNALYFVDIKNPRLHRYDPASGERRSWTMPERVGCVAPRAKGGFVGGAKSGFAFIHPPEMRVEPAVDPEPERPDNRFNDGVCDAAGRFWAGTMDDEEGRPRGYLYRLDPDLSWARTDGPYVVTNGPAISPDGKTLYHADTVGGEVHAFDLGADGGLSNKRLFCAFGGDDGHPDGLTCDALGGVWIGHWGGFRLSRFAPDGTVERVVRLPVAQVTKCAFGGPELRTLFITTAAINRDEPQAGGLFVLDDVGVAGMPAAAFAG